MSDNDDNSPASLILPIWTRCCENLETMLHERGWASVKWCAPVASLHRQFCFAQSLVVQLLLATEYHSPVPDKVCNLCPGGVCSLVVYACLTRNLTSPATQNMDTLRHPGISHSLVLFQDKITALPRADPVGYSTVRRFEPKLFRSLFVNVTRHKLVPPHRRLTDQEQSSLLARYHCPTDKLPVIYVTDPVCRYYDFPVGAIIEILRPDPHYRCVVLAPPASNYEKFFALSPFLPCLP